MGPFDRQERREITAPCGSGTDRPRLGSNQRCTHQLAFGRSPWSELHRPSQLYESRAALSLLQGLGLQGLAIAGHDLREWEHDRVREQLPHSLRAEHGALEAHEVDHGRSTEDSHLMPLPAPAAFQAEPALRRFALQSPSVLGARGASNDGQQSQPVRQAERLAALLGSYPRHRCAIRLRPPWRGTAPRPDAACSREARAASASTSAWQAAS